MKKCILGLALLFTSLTLLAQNPKGFDAMCNGYIEGTVALVSPKQVNRIMGVNEIVLLDARETREYNISHIKGALKIGYDNFKLATVKEVDKSKPVYVYCSIGYRSEKIGEKLKKAGFTKVYNMYGGIFNWANSGDILVDGEGKETTKVHGYNKEWSKWLNGEKCTKIVD